MNTREAMQALLDGKKLRRKNWPQNGKYVEMRDDLIYDNIGRPVSLEFCDGTRADGLNFEIYEEPNPHQKGTFAWAREEAKRGRKVRVTKPSGGYNEYAPDSCCWDEYGAWYSFEVDATDWQVVS